MITKYLAIGNSGKITNEELCLDITVCGELGSGLHDTKDEAQFEADQLVDGGVFEVKLEFKKV